MNNRKLLIACLVMTLMGAAGFLVVKAIEYSADRERHVWVGQWNMYSGDYDAQSKYKQPRPPSPHLPM